MTNEDAIKILEEMPIASIVHFEEIAEAIEIAIKALRNERPQGEWIDLGYALEEYRAWGKCSVCGDGMFQSDFCPNCGADMREADNETISSRT